MHAAAGATGWLHARNKKLSRPSAATPSAANLQQRLSLKLKRPFGSAGRRALAILVKAHQLGNLLARPIPVRSGATIHAKSII
jgi:hypothetical protein